MDADAEEQRKVARLLRFVAVCVAFPTLSISLAFLLFTDDWRAHMLHSVGFLAVGLAALGLWVVAPRLAAKAGQG